jgi:hypothetical protein
MDSPAAWHAKLNQLRNEMRLDEIDALFAEAPAEIRANFDVASVWVSIPRMRKDAPEMLRRAEWFANHHPRAIKAAAHLLYALAKTGPYDEVCRRIAAWEERWPGQYDILGPAADVALEHGDHLRVIAICERMATERPDIYRGHFQRAHILALARSGWRAEAARVLAEARASYPEYPYFDGLGV